MSFTVLPAELILEIAELLPNCAVIRFAFLTFNKQITAACDELIVRTATAKRYKKRMFEWFGTSQMNWDGWPCIQREFYDKVGNSQATRTL